MLNKNQDNDTMDMDAMVASLPSSEALKVTVAPRHNVVGTDAFNLSTTQVCATIQARELALDDQSTESSQLRAPVDIEVSLDLSASMSGDKLESCKKTLELLIHQLLPNDRFGLVSFSDQAVIEIPIRKLTETTKNFAVEKIKSLQTKGCTNISAGIGLAAQEMVSVQEPNKVQSVFLLTDGHANRGISTAGGIINVAHLCFVPNKTTNKEEDESTNAARPPITIHCFGYGTDHDDKLLTGISEVTRGGTYYFVDKDSNVATAFGDALGGILSVVAQNAVLNVHVPPEAVQMGVEITSIHHEHTVQREEGSHAIMVGDFYAEETRDVLFNVKLASPTTLSRTPIPHVMVSLSYMDTIQKQLVTSKSFACSVARPPGIEVSSPNRRTALQWLRVYTAKEIAHAQAVSQCGNLWGARETLKDCKHYVQAQEELQADPLVLQLLFDLDNAVDGLMSPEHYARYGSKILHATRQSHAMQRSSIGSPLSPSIYRTPSKEAYAMNFNKR